MADLNLLVALNYLNDRAQGMIRESGNVCFLLDSGAFTTWKQGREIELDDYCEQLENLKITPWKYFTLDKIGNPKQTMENLLELKRRGYSPIPIFTRGEDPKHLDDLYSLSDVVGIGGLVGTQKNKGFVNGIMSHIRKRPCHWLGFTSHDFVSHYRPFSVDSSSWSAPMRFGGNIPIYCGFGKWRQLTKNDFIKSPSTEVTRLIEEHGERPELFRFEAGWRNASNNNIRSVGFRLLAKTYVRYMFDVERTLGTKLFLAAGCDGEVLQLLKAAKFWNDHVPRRVRDP